MIDLGDPVVLTFNVTDGNGAPADAGASVLTVTLPDASTIQPAVVHAGVGVYTATFVTTQAGRHGVRWVATGANAQTYADVFNVAPAAPGLLISLAEARGALGNVPAAATAKDEDLRTAISEATPILEDLVGPIIPRVCDEWHDGGQGVVRVLYAPLISVTAVVESWGSFTRNLTQDVLDVGPFSAYGFTVDLVDGFVQRRVVGRAGVFPRGRRNVHVTYTAGRSVVSPNIYKGARRLIRHLWQQEQQAFRPAMGQPDANPMALTPSGFAVPRAVIEILGAEVREIGLA